jgi:hypothetical protein
VNSRSRAISPVALAAIAGVAATALVVGTLAALGLPLLPNAAGADEGSEAPVVVPVAAIEDSPAAAVVDEVLARRGDAGYRGERAVTQSPAAAFARWCPAAESETAPISRSRVYRVSGSSPITVTVAAYGAGQGGGAVAAFGERMRSCGSGVVRGAAVGADDDLGDASTEAVVGFVTPVAGGSSASALVWRRDDLVMTVFAAGAASTRLASAAQVFDARARVALAPVCASSAPSLDDVTRSPWQSGAYTGNLQPREAPLVYNDPTPSPTPSYPRGVTPVPVPAETPLLPSLPEVLPTSLPTGLTPAPSPSPPVAPTPVPESVIVGEQVVDPVGPGCGWAFTGQGVPAFDSEAAAASFLQRFSDAQETLRLQDLEWQIAKVVYAEEWAVFIEQAELFSAYANAVNDALANEQDSEYLAELEAWELARDEAAAFRTAQAAARNVYEAALLACGVPTPGAPTPSASASATSEPTPSPTALDPSAQPSQAPTVGGGCPPTRPVILDQPVPTVPPSPRPPR